MCWVHIGCGISAAWPGIGLGMLLEEDASCFYIYACASECSLRGSQEALWASWSSRMGIASCTTARRASFAHGAPSQARSPYLAKPLRTRCASAYEIFIAQPGAAIGLTLRQRLRMHRHLRLCLGLRLSQQAEGDVGIMELLDPGAGGFMENG